MTAADDLARARQVLTVEAEALKTMAEGLGDSFVRAVEAVLLCEGRIIVSGMGKSGHVARKISATLAGTGSPAQFVHPAEASHGDLGMVTKKDVLIMLSRSGEAQELSDLVAHSRRFGIKLIAVTAKPQSLLGQAADILLLVPDLPEVCPMGLAPTTSTTMMMALGDALAIAVLERRGFNADDFRQLHPGGKLGRALLKVADLMHKGEALPLVKADTAMADVLSVMSEKRFGCTGIIDAKGALTGIITDGDLRRRIKGGDNLLTLTAGQVMTAKPLAVGPDLLAVAAVKTMNEHTPKVTVLFVTDEAGKAIGILHIHDLLRAGLA